jgi:hypothetical protein
MKFDFYSEKIVCLDYRRGTIIARTRKENESDWQGLCEEHRAEYIAEYGDKFLLEIYYVREGYGIVFYLVGTHIDFDDTSLVQKEIVNMIQCGYMDDCINVVEAEMDEWNAFLSETFDENIKNEAIWNAIEVNKHLKNTDRLN